MLGWVEEVEAGELQALSIQGTRIMEPGVHCVSGLKNLKPMKKGQFLEYKPALNSPSLFSPSPAPAPLISFLSLGMSLFWIFCIRGITEYVVVSGFFHLAQGFQGLSMSWHGAVLYSFSRPNNTPLHGYATI